MLHNAYASFPNYHLMDFSVEIEDQYIIEDIIVDDFQIYKVKRDDSNKISYVLIISEDCILLAQNEDYILIELFD